MGKQRESGLSMSMFLFWCVILAFGSLLAFKLVPAYTDDLTIKRHFRTIAGDSTFASGNRREIEVAFSKRAEIDRIDAISPKDIVVSKDSSGLTLSASYTRVVPIVANLSACIDFNPSSR
ncbi:MAG: DUF4845 domain-containing protein [Betaproteobacteria bacterium]|nr:DUF4845 domain-containing protein [Betaproteobacteria bacterium]